MIRILLADDHKIVREGIRSLLEKQQGIEVIGEAEDGRKILRLARKLDPDIIVMDITMPKLNGIEATRRLMREFPDTKVIALSMHGDRRFVEEIFQAGASGYLLKDSTFNELIEAISKVMEDRIYLSSEITGIVVKDLVDRLLTEEARSQLDVLTSREREILQLIAEGENTKAIASILNISIKTVETHRQHIIHKLDIDNVAGLTKFAIRHGLTSLKD